MPRRSGPRDPRVPFIEGDRVRLNEAYCTKWKVPEWKEWGSRLATVVYSDASRIDIIFDRVHQTRGRQIQAMLTNPDLLERATEKAKK